LRHKRGIGVQPMFLNNHPRGRERRKGSWIVLSLANVRVEHVIGHFYRSDNPPGTPY